MVLTHNELQRVDLGITQLIVNQPTKLYNVTQESMLEGGEIDAFIAK